VGGLVFESLLGQWVVVEMSGLLVKYMFHGQRFGIGGVKYGK
jgi:hypothetical protein